MYKMMGSDGHQRALAAPCAQSGSFALASASAPFMLVFDRFLIGINAPQDNAQ
jgi:hypothetical protein